MSTGHKSADDISKSHIDQAVAQLLKLVQIDDKHWVPYLGGYSKDFEQQPQIFFDARFPDSLMVGGKQMRPYRYVVIHEAVEKSLMDCLKLHYLSSHYLATCAEKSAVLADGFDWDLYCQAIKPFIAKVVKNVKGLQVPLDLDLTPYIESHDTKELREMHEQ